MVFNKVFLYHQRSKKQTGNTNKKIGIYQDKFETREGFGCYYFKNVTLDKKINIDIDMKNSTNIKLFFPFSDLQAQFSLEPGQDGVVVFEALQFPYKTSLRMNFTVQKVVQKEKEMSMKDTIKKLGKKKEIVSNEIKKTNIFSYSLSHKKGYAILLSNKSNKYILSKFYKF